jgi:branched-chain amino acid transport system ATP-binding protein
MTEHVAVNGNGSTPRPSALDVAEVRFAYGDLVAVWDVSFSARAGAVTAVVGRNGAGKTTLMFGIAGVLPATAGTIRLAGRDVTRASSWDRSVAGLCLVPEGKRVFRELTVEENLAVGLPRRLRGAERRERCNEVYERFPILAERRQQLAGALSGGQQQMLAIGSALAMRPRVLLVDEPSSGLAPTTVDTVMETLAQLKSEGIAIVLVEQMIEDVVTGIADEVVVVEQGRVVLRDVPERISLSELERRLYVA